MGLFLYICNVRRRNTDNVIYLVSLRATLTALNPLERVVFLFAEKRLSENKNVYICTNSTLKHPDRTAI